MTARFHAFRRRARIADSRPSTRERRSMTQAGSASKPASPTQADSSYYTLAACSHGGLSSIVRAAWRKLESHSPSNEVLSCPNPDVQNVQITANSARIGGMFGPVIPGTNGGPTEDTQPDYGLCGWSLPPASRRIPARIAKIRTIVMIGLPPKCSPSTGAASRGAA